MEVQAARAEIDALKADNQGFSNNISGLKSEIKSDINSLRNDLKILNVKNATLNKKHSLFERKISYLNSLMIEYEQASYANKIRLSNIPFSETEDIFSLIKIIGEFIGCTVVESDIDFSYRLKLKRLMPLPPIIIKFVRKEMKNKFFSLFWAKKESINTNLFFATKLDNPKKIYISEDMGRETTSYLVEEEDSQPMLIRNGNDFVQFGYDIATDLEECSSFATGDETETDEVLTHQIGKPSKKRKFKRSQSCKISEFLKPSLPNVKPTLPSPLTTNPNLPSTSSVKPKQDLVTPLPKND
uniref:Uncharacterized protein n=1 Tax=Rhodnius prolixus TaxID=13249 RepID=T1ICA8_RHOPR